MQIQHPQSRSYPSALLITQLLLSIICVVNLFTMVNYLFQNRLPQYLFVVAVCAAIAINFLLAKRLGIQKAQLIRPTLTALLLIAASFLISWFYFDLSWDGQWYQQAAVYNLANGWNPLRNPLVTPDQTDNTSVLHFPKSAWYFGATILKLTGTVEIGKAYNILMFFAAYGVVYALCRNLKLSVIRAVIFSLLVVLNPVVSSEMVTYLNDGNLYLSLVIYLTAITLWLCNPKPSFIATSAMAVCCLTNTKFTGPIFFLAASFCIFIYVIIRQRNRIKSYLLAHILMAVLAIGVFGYNPYVTNLLERGHPLYPLMGTKEFPSVFTGGKDDNEDYETPENMRGKSLLTRLYYANFGKPGNAPYNKEKEAVLTKGLNFDLKSWVNYHYHETRVSGFGPYFGISLVLMAVSIVLVLIRKQTPWLQMALFFIGLICCLWLSRHFWWPRFFPMLWLAPLIPLLLMWKYDAENDNLNKANPIFSWTVALLMCLNGLVVATIHLKWETQTSVKLRSDLQQLSIDGKHIDVRYGWFKTAVEEKLKHWNIPFTPVKFKKKSPGAKILPLVVDGYPNQVYYRLAIDSVRR